MRFYLPHRIGKEDRFTWGPVVKIHSIVALNIDVVEYHPLNHDTKQYETETTHFHPYVNQKDSCRSCHSLEAAIVYSIAEVKFGRNIGLAEAQCACKLLDVV